MSIPTVDDIVALYENLGKRQYGREAVSQLEHALQCAFLAERSGASPALVAASFLHDIGHMVGISPLTLEMERPLLADGWLNDCLRFFRDGRSHEYQHTPVEQEALAVNPANDLHEHRAQWYLHGLFGPDVLEPIRLHVEAKRFLCHAEPDYWDTLSPESKRSLEIQGGRYDGEQSARFNLSSHAGDAVMLRRWDDGAKVPGAKTPDLSHYRSVLESVTLA